MSVFDLWGWRLTGKNTSLKKLVKGVVYCCLFKVICDMTFGN